MDYKGSYSKKREALEMWVYRRTLKISWIARKSNKEVLTKIGREKTVIGIIKRRKNAYLGHILSGEKNTLLQTIMQGRVVGRMGVGRKKKWLRNIRDWTNMITPELFGTAKHREMFWSSTSDRRGH